MIYIAAEGEIKIKEPYKLKPSLCRFVAFYPKGSGEIPAELYDYKNQKPELKNFPRPLPSKKSDYVASLKVGNVEWLGAKTGLTRYEPGAEREENVVMYFSAPRDLCDDDVKAVMPDGKYIWVLTETGAARIETRSVGAREKARMLLDETLKYVERRGMVSQRRLARARDFGSRFPYAESDNDGEFTATFAIGEILRYATLTREKGADDPETLEARKTATRSVEACLLLMHIHSRGDGFVARSYHCSGEPLPDDGIFFKINAGKAVCVENRTSINKGCSGVEIDAGAEVPRRLAKLYEDLGYTINDATYKADTSSDEITLHFLELYFAFKFLADGDPELGELIRKSVKGLMDHIIGAGYRLLDFDGKPTTWARWDGEYFESAAGWVDAALNAAELLAYHLITMEITGEKGRYLESYENLIKEGYADLTEKHFDRLYQASLSMNFDFMEDIMFGDHMLAAAAFWALCSIEKDAERLKKYRAGFKAWRTSLEREHNPAYDMIYALSLPGEEIDFERLAEWFYRTNPSRLAAGTSLEGRKDVPVRKLLSGRLETSVLLPPDERFISKYDRNPFEYKNEDSGGVFCIESCYVYTFAYWLGIYYEFFA